jgi:acyl-CoA synthetase (NDP forming)
MAAPRLTIRRLLHPTSVAVIGAADTEDKWGGRVMLHLKKHGFAGCVVPVNPRRSQVLGLPAFPAITAVPHPIDVAVVALPAEPAVSAIRECAAAGVGACVIITAQFAEVGGEGAARQSAIVDIARGSGMRLLGPNCLGLVNAHHKAALSPSLSLSTMTHVPPGGIGVVSQSGALMGSLLIRGFDIGAGFSSCVSVGNQADLDLCDFFEYLIDDPATQVICLYLEGLQDGHRFAALAARAQRRGKPVLAAKAGRTEQGARAVHSHTASLAGSHAVFAAVCAKHGVVLMQDALDLLAAAETIIHRGRLRAGGVAVFSGSGGSGALWTDAAEESGLRLGRLAGDTRSRLGAFLPTTHCDLPIDLGVIAHATGTPAYAEALAHTVSTVMADPDVGAGFYVMTTQPDTEVAARAAAAASAESGKPVLFVNAAGSSGEAARRILRERHHLNFDTPDEALRTLKALASDYAQRRAYEARSREETPAPFSAGAPDLTDLPRGALAEVEAKALLRRFGVPVTREALADTPRAAADCAGQIGYPVALKGSARGLLHKSDLGAVRLGLGDAAAVEAAFHDIRDNLARAGYGPEQFHGCVVQEMVESDAELILGARYDPQFGPIVLIGMGGILVELLHDVRLLPAPLGHGEALAALRGLKLFPLLDGYRGASPVDLDGIADLAVKVGDMAAILGATLVELDINPLLVRGNRAIAADARATIA